VTAHRKTSGFVWSPAREAAAFALAEGKTQREAAAEAEVTDRTIRLWLREPEFAAEVDRLSLMVGVASRAERLRLAQRVIRQKTTEDGKLESRADVLDWLKFAQSETDGIKLDLAKLATALGADAPPLADTGSD
jgi:predicted transcriptional regulator